MTAARERAVRVVAEALGEHRVTHTVGYFRIGVCACGITHTVVSSQEHQAEAVVAALEADMGLRTEQAAYLAPEDEPTTTPAVMTVGGRELRTRTRLVTDWMGDNT